MQSASGVCFDKEPPTPSKPADGPQLKLVYTHLWTELLKMGVLWDEALRMSWGTARMLFSARAEAYEVSKDYKPSDTRYATNDDIANWI